MRDGESAHHPRSSLCLARLEGLEDLVDVMSNTVGDGCLGEEPQHLVHRGCGIVYVDMG